MAFFALPLITKAGAGLMKIGSAMKGAGAAKSLGMNAAYLGKGKAAAAKVAPKMAGATDDSLGILGKIKRGLTSKEGFLDNYGRPIQQDLGMALAPDLMFGGLTALMTPGDLADKAIAGAGTAVGGAAGGIAARGVFGPKSNLGILAAELGGGIAGDTVGMGVTDSILRMKGGGMTPYEKQAAAGNQEYENQLRAQIMAEYGLV
jgi:hypothetical protein